MSAASARPETHWDAIVVGGGHNALVTAAYLAKAGQRTLVLERRDRVGGAAETSELGGAPRPALAHTVGRLRPSVVRGPRPRSPTACALVAPDVRVFAPQPDGRGGHALGRPGAGPSTRCAAWSARDADAYPDFDRLVRSLGRFLAELAPHDAARHPRARASATRSPG